MNIFVAKLNPGTTSQDLQKLFSHYGFVFSVNVITDHMTGRSKGYGFIEMPNSDEANEAIKELDSTSFQEAILIVKNSQASNRGSGNPENPFYVSHETRNWNHGQYTRDTTINREILQNQNHKRNFGYRGIGRKGLDQY